MEGVGIALTVARGVLWGAAIVCAFRGTPRAAMLSMFSPWLACVSLASAVRYWSRHEAVWAGVEMVAAAIWAWLWWSNRPPRPPRRRRVLRAVRAGA